jgi:hypothetical protein
VRRLARLISSIRSRFVKAIVFLMNTIIVYKWVLQSTSRMLKQVPNIVLSRSRPSTYFRSVRFGPLIPCGLVG